MFYFQSTIQLNTQVPQNDYSTFNLQLAKIITLHHFYSVGAIK